MSIVSLDSIDIDRLVAEIDALAAYSAHPAPAVTRVLFSPEDLGARAWLRARCEEAGLAVRVDAVGNMFARWTGRDPSLPAVATGSHADAIPGAGKFDGVVGVLGGLEAIRALRRLGFEPERSIEWILFTAEEPTRFGIGCLGSRLLGHAMTVEQASRLRDSDGRDLESWRREAGCAGSLESVALPGGFYAAFVELHIEQGPILEAGGESIGVVESIAAPAAIRIGLQGQGGHAGAVLMGERRDALLAAAEIALAVEEAAITSGSPDTVGTTGVLEILPAAINSIPCEARMMIDFRDTDEMARDRALVRLENAARAIAARRQTAMTWEWIQRDPPARCDANLVATLESSARALGLSHRRMISRAYHDALFMARVAPTSMIFIPCFRGYSHRPDEYSSPADIARGTAVLAESLRQLAGPGVLSA
jgi:N-carbamoyl-L-amino-acid hydrolase